MAAIVAHTSENQGARMRPSAEAFPLHFVHFMPSFDPGGAQVRVAELMNFFGRRCRHTVFVMRDGFGTRERVSPEIDLTCQKLELSGGAVVRVCNLMKLLRSLNPDLILTYNWGAIEAALAAVLSKAAPLVHGEDGFGPDEALRQKRRRVWLRWLILRYADAVVPPSLSLERIMREEWGISERVVQYIPNGVDIQHFTPLERFGQKAEIVVSTVGQLRPEKRQDMLIRACATLHEKRPVRLLIAGAGPERSRLEATAQSLQFLGQISFLGHLSDVRPVLQQSDIFALSSMTEQMPISVLEAMACGLPVLSTDVGDVRAMVSDTNRAFVCHAEKYQDSLELLAADETLRRKIGAANRARCVETYSRSGMLASYEKLYSRLTGGLVAGN